MRFADVEGGGRARGRGGGLEVGAGGGVIMSSSCGRRYERRMCGRGGRTWSGGGRARLVGRRASWRSGGAAMEVACGGEGGRRKGMEADGVEGEDTEGPDIWILSS